MGICVTFSCMELLLTAFSLMSFAGGWQLTRPQTARCSAALAGVRRWYPRTPPSPAPVRERVFSPGTSGACGASRKMEFGGLNPRLGTARLAFVFLRCDTHRPLSPLPPSTFSTIFSRISVLTCSRECRGFWGGNNVCFPSARAVFQAQGRRGGSRGGCDAALVQGGRTRTRARRALWQLLGGGGGEEPRLTSPFAKQQLPVAPFLIAST